MRISVSASWIAAVITCARAQGRAKKKKTARPGRGEHCRRGPASQAKLCELSWRGLRDIGGSNVANDASGEPGETPEYVALPTQAGLCVGGPCVFPSFSWDLNGN